MTTLIGILIYAVLYLLSAFVSFFAFAKLINSKSGGASTLIIMSLLFPIFWFIVLSLTAWFKLQEYAEKYLEKINEGQDE